MLSNESFKKPGTRLFIVPGSGPKPDENGTIRLPTVRDFPSHKSPRWKQVARLKSR